MSRLIRFTVFFTLMLSAGAQAMIVLERGAWVTLTLGQCLALLYWPDPAAASAFMDAVTGGAGIVAKVFATPAVIAFAALWLAAKALGDKPKR